MGSFKQSYLIRLLKSILVISGLIGTSIYGEQTFYQISSIINGNGKIVPPNDIKVKEGNKKKVKFIADTLYLVDSVKIDDVNIGAISEYTFNNVEKDHEIIVWFSSVIPETTIVLNEKHSINKDTIIDKSSFINNEKDTVNIICITEYLTKSLILQTDSLSDNQIFSTTYDTTIICDSNIISKNYDTLYYIPFIDFETKTFKLTGRDTVFLKDTSINWDYDTLINTIAEEFVRDTFITVIETLIDNVIVSSNCDTVINFWSEVVFEKVDTLKYVKPDDMTSLSYNVSSSLKEKSGLSAVPNPFEINSDNLKIIFNTKHAIAEASLIIYDKLGNLISSINVYDKEFDKSIIFEWDGFSDNGQVVSTSSVIAVIRVTFLNGKTVKNKVLIGIKR